MLSSTNWLNVAKAWGGSNHWTVVMCTSPPVTIAALTSGTNGTLAG
jgi:hypothetical protein